MEPVAVMMTGVCRPNLDTIKSNIQHNIDFFQSKFSNVHFYVVTYQNQYSHDLSQYLNPLKNMNYQIIEPINETIGNHRLFTNTYRMWKSIEQTVNLIEIQPKIVFRIRLDSILHVCEIPTELKENTYYAYYCNNSKQQISDNISFSSLDVMKTIWNADKLTSKVLKTNNETILYNITTSHNIKIQPTRFKYEILQSGDEFYDGIPQWSRRNRLFDC